MTAVDREPTGWRSQASWSSDDETPARLWRLIGMECPDMGSPANRNSQSQLSQIGMAGLSASERVRLLSERVPEKQRKVAPFPIMACAANGLCRLVRRREDVRNRLAERLL